MEVFLCVMAAIFALGMVADKEKDKTKVYATSFGLCVVGMVILRIIG